MKVRGGPTRAGRGVAPHLNIIASPAAAATLPPGVLQATRGHRMAPLEEVRARFARDPGLPFAACLSRASILAALDEHGGRFRDRLFNPITPIWGFLSQALSDDPSGRDAVWRILAHRAASGLEPCSS